MPFWGAKARHWQRSVLELVFPWSCLLCRKSGEQPRAPEAWAPWLCHDCYEDIPFLDDSACPRCSQPAGLHLPDDSSCPRCQKDKDWPKTDALFQYEEKGRELVHALKYRSEVALAPLFGCELAKRFRGDAPDLVTAVPMHWTRRLWRGYNQAEEVARAVAKNLDCPYKSIFKRRKMTPALFNKSRAERQGLVQNAFSNPPSSLQGKKIVIVDDVATTGSTLKELCRLLKEVKARSIRVMVVGLTPPGDDY